MAFLCSSLQRNYIYFLKPRERVTSPHITTRPKSEACRRRRFARSPVRGRDWSRRSGPGIRACGHPVVRGREPPSWPRSTADDASQRGRPPSMPGGARHRPRPRPRRPSPRRWTAPWTGTTRGSRPRWRCSRSARHGPPSAVSWPSSGGTPSTGRGSTACNTSTTTAASSSWTPSHAPSTATATRSRPTSSKP